MSEKKPFNYWRPTTDGGSAVMFHWLLLVAIVYIVRGVSNKIGAGEVFVDVVTGVFAWYFVINVVRAAIYYLARWKA